MAIDNSLHSLQQTSARRSFASQQVDVGTTLVAMTDATTPLPVQRPQEDGYRDEGEIEQSAWPRSWIAHADVEVEAFTRSPFSVAREAAAASYILASRVSEEIQRRTSILRPEEVPIATGEQGTLRRRPGTSESDAG